MKSIKLLIVLVLVLSLLTGCNFSLANLPIIGSPQTVSNSPPPDSFDLRSFAEVEALLNADKMTDVQVDEFIAQHQSGWGLRNESDLNKFSEILNTVGYPVVDCRVDYFRLTGHPSTGDYQVVYRINDVRYRFVYKALGRSIDTSGRKVVGTYEIDGIQFPLYVGDGGFLAGFIDANGYQIWIQVDNYGEISNVSFEPFSWSTDMKLAD